MTLRVLHALLWTRCSLIRMCFGIVLHSDELFNSRSPKIDTRWIPLTETVTESNVIAIASLVSEIWLATEWQKYTHTHTRTVSVLPCSLQKSLNCDFANKIQSQIRSEERKTERKSRAISPKTLDNKEGKQKSAWKKSPEEWLHGLFPTLNSVMIPNNWSLFTTLMQASRPTLRGGPFSL